MNRLRNKKALLFLWFFAINYAFIVWVASCGGRPFLKGLTDYQTEFLLLGSVRAAAVVIFFVRPLNTYDEQRSFMRFAVKLIIIFYAFWLYVGNVPGQLYKDIFVDKDIIKEFFG